MRDGWCEVKLGQIFEATNERLGDYREEPPVFSVTKYAGVVVAGDFFGKRVASANLGTYKVLQPNDWAYSTIHIDEGSIARNLLGTSGVVSPMYTTMRFRSSLALAAYCELVLRSQAMLDTFQRRQQGSIDRRRSLPWRAFSEIDLVLPSLTEQRRIVDLIVQLDRAAAAYAAAREAAASLLVVALEERQSVAAASRAPLESVFRHVIGGAWGEPPGVAEVDVLALGPSAYADRREVDLSRATLRSLSSKRAADRTLLPDDIILERSGGTPTQPVGRVIRMTAKSSAPVVPSDFQRLLRPDPEVAEPAYVFWQMWANYQAGRTVPFQKATTNIRNLNIPDYLRQATIALPDRGEQRRIVALADSTAATLDHHISALDSLAGLRSNLLDALLSGEHEIPKSYDELLAG